MADGDPRGPLEELVVGAVILAVFLLHQARLVPLPPFALPTLVADVVLGLALTAVATRVAVMVRGRLAGAGAFVALLALTAWYANFSYLSPRAYFTLHRWEFGSAASATPGERLPPHLAHLALDGEADQTAHGAILLMSWAGLVDNAGGYVHAEAWVAPATYVELHGRTMPLSRCVPLRDGWWYC